MSVRNGDKARYGRERKQKIHRRERMRALRQALLHPAPPKAEGEHHGGVLETTAQTIGATLGSIVAKTTGRSRKPQPKT